MICGMQSSQMFGFMHHALVNVTPCTLPDWLWLRYLWYDVLLCVCLCVNCSGRKVCDAPTAQTFCTVWVAYALFLCPWWDIRQFDACGSKCSISDEQGFMVVNDHLQ
jgi:hypothetical protein